ncbi:T-lymphocyte surface antigen Ly-9-like [Scleropages formosus]|uniref:T-lymphocyte surface antigen Ly-9-like n=1 Tax=Scleropages formosus TaxID=113540 RepID=UPI0008791570|nr:T-lymphocyte surface antigen Ly-9-like [Scleropages formosus]
MSPYLSFFLMPKYKMNKVFFWFSLLTLIHGVKNTEIKCIVGTTVTLPSGLNTFSNPSSIKWTINVDNSKKYIIFFSDSETIPGSYDPLRDRVSLNTTTGDLEIRSVKLTDSDTYAVEIENKEAKRHSSEVILSVYERLPEPNIAVTNGTYKHELCRMSLLCSVRSGDVKFNWSSEPLPYGCYLEPLQNSTATTSSHTTSELTAWCNPDRTVDITCTVRNNMSSNTSTTATKCPLKQKCKDIDECRTPPCSFFTPFIVGVITSTFLCALIYALKGKIHNFWNKHVVPCGGFAKYSSSENSSDQASSDSHPTKPLKSDSNCPDSKTKNAVAL